MNLCKIITSVAWVLGIAAYFFSAPSGIGSALRAVPVFLLVAHILETIVFWKVIKNAAGSRGSHVVNTLIFGLCHLAPIKKRQDLAIR